MKRSLLLALLIVLTALTSWAVPARRGTFTATLSDGTTATLELVGDEHFHYYRNVATGQPMQQTADGTFAVIDAATFAARKLIGEERSAAASTRRMARLAQRRTTAAPAGPNKVGTMKPASGQKKGLVILVNFSDKAINSKNTQKLFSRMFNEEGFSDYNHIGSVHDYFAEQSYGKLDLTFDVVGPVTVSKTMAYYGQNDSHGDDVHPATMIAEACKLVDAQVNFADYDWDGDGEVDQVFVIYAGYGENYNGVPSNTIWPHEWTLAEAKTYGDGSGAFRLDGVKIDTYACSNELRGASGSNISPIGTACHEFSHCLGFPDFYDTSEEGTAYGMGNFDLMDHGSYNGPSGYGEVPCGYTAYERWMAGWLTPVELKEPKTVRTMPDIAQHPAAYVIYNSGTRNEYLLLENRKDARWFSYFGSSVLKGHGLFVTHVDYSSSVWEDNEVNATASHQRMSPVPASAYFATTTSAAARMFFPTGATALDESSHTTCGGQWFNYNKAGKKTLGHIITDIAFAADSIAFKFDGGEPEDDGSRYTVTLDPGTGRCAPATLTQTTFRQTFALPTATPPADGWTFAGWATAAAYGAKPTQLLAAGSDYRPAADVTLYAVYAEAAPDATLDGAYVLDYNAETDLQKNTMGYSNAFSYTAADGGVWTIKAYKNAGLQINAGKNASIKIPQCPGPITTIAVTGSTTKKVSFAATDYTGSTAPTALATGTAATQQTLDLSKTDVREGYLYTTDGATSITRITVSYGLAANYYTYPDVAALIVPTVTLPAAELSLLLGDAPRAFPASVTGSTAAVVYTSSDPAIATVSPQGVVTPAGLGTATITASVPAVAGESRPAQTTANVTVAMPALTAISIAQQPTKTVYIEGETFDPAGLRLTATYANGYTQTILPGATGLTLQPAAALSPSDAAVTVSYTEGTVTRTATIAISVTPLPRFTVTLDAAGGQCATPTLTETAAGQGIILPTATTTADGWAFAGWTTAPLYATAATSPTLLDAATRFMPTADVTLHAVYVHTETTGEGSGNYERVTAARDDWSGQYLIVMRDASEASAVHCLVANGSTGGKNGIGASNSGIAPAEAGYLDATDAYAPAQADAYSVKLIATTKGYLLQTADGLYNASATSGTSSGVNTTSDATKAVPLSVIFDSADNVRIAYVSPSDGKTIMFVFSYNLDASNNSYFRFYSKSTADGYISSGRTATLYRKTQGTTLTTYTSYPVATICTLVKAIKALAPGTTTLSDIDALIGRILQK